MKQHITPEQLNELTGEQKERLREWWEPDNGQWVYAKEWDGLYSAVSLGKYFFIDVNSCSDGGCGCCSSGIDLNDCLPLLSIGQMIELIKNKVQDANNNRLIMWERKPNIWNVELLDRYDEKRGEGHLWIVDEPELCDALWQTVKKVL